MVVKDGHSKAPLDGLLSPSREDKR